MAIQGKLLGNVISLKNATGSDASPNLIYEIDTTAGQFKAVGGAGGSAIGVLLPDLRYENGVVPDGKESSIQIDGIVDVVAGGTIHCGDYVIVNSAGQVVSVGDLSNLTFDKNTEIFGRALESGENGDIISVLIRPQVIVIGGVS